MQSLFAHILHVSEQERNIKVIICIIMVKKYDEKILIHLYVYNMIMIVMWDTNCLN